MRHLTDVEAEYQTAKARLQAAQQEKLDATADFLAARTALGQELEAVWPAFYEYGENIDCESESHGPALKAAVQCQTSAPPKIKRAKAECRNWV